MSFQHMIWLKCFIFQMLKMIFVCLGFMAVYVEIDICIAC